MCVALFRQMISNTINRVLCKISICFNGRNGRRAIIRARYGDDAWKRIVELPFDAFDKIGKYKIDWQPDRIVTHEYFSNQ